MRNLTAISKDIKEIDDKIWKLYVELKEDHFDKVKNNKRKLRHLIAQLPKGSTIRKLWENLMRFDRDGRKERFKKAR